MILFERYITVKNRNYNGRVFGETVKRMVNQKEIIEYLKRNPGKTENQIMEDIYGFYRNETWESNKKYADCLRRALNLKKINRVKANTKKGTRYIYFAL